MGAVADKRSVRLGGGSAGAEERLDPAVELAAVGNIDYLCFDSLSEVELSSIKRDRGSAAGFQGSYEDLTRARLEAVIPVCARNGVKIIGNMGASDPESVREMAIDIARKNGIHGLRVAAVLGDEVLADIRRLDPALADSEGTVAKFGDRLVSAHAYIPAESIAEALAHGADIVLTGRIGDASLFLGPLLHEFGWPADDWDLRARGIVVGHLLECGAQITGGFFADPPYKVVPNLHRVGFPIAEVFEDGRIVISKSRGSGGLVSPATCREQMLYEIDDPSNYKTADVIVDIHDVDFEQIAVDEVELAGVVRGKPAPQTLKVSLGVREGFMGSGTVYYGGPGALGRAKLAAEIVRLRIEDLRIQPEKLSISLLGISGLYDSAPGVPEVDPWEVGVRVAALTTTRAEAVTIAREGSTVLSNNGPAGVSCRQRQYELKEVMGYYHCFIDRDLITPTVTMQES